MKLCSICPTVHLIYENTFHNMQVGYCFSTVQVQIQLNMISD